MISPDELLQALQKLTPDQIATMLGQNTGRSPIRDRQLDDLTLKPSARDPRPTFYGETDAREFQPITQKPYPKLLWHINTGEEITVRDEHEEKTRGVMWTPVAPVAGPSDPEAVARRLFEALGPEDQAFILEHEHQMRLDTVKRAMAQLTASQAATIVAMPPPNGKRVNGDRH
jgi:hypothetical protein